jgi:hypothetical protein
VIPLAEKRSDSGDQRQRLVEHHVVACLRYLDHGSNPAEADVDHALHGGVNHSVFRSEEGHATVEASQHVRGEKWAFKYAWIELPTPSRAVSGDRVLGNVRLYVRQCWLRRYRTKREIASSRDE